MSATPRPLRKLNRRNRWNGDNDTPFSVHSPMDNACLHMMEQIPYDAGGFDRQLRADMATRTLNYLHLHYPELVFQFADSGSRRPKGHDVTEKAKNGLWCVADWRH